MYKQKRGGYLEGEFRRLDLGVKMSKKEGLRGYLSFVGSDMGNFYLTLTKEVCYENPSGGPARTWGQGKC